ncbi:phage tail fiber protein [Azorhizophilus paspali]|uniref:Phage tail fiber protein n=1 Tax=Azorhizophilus paspali TaxID=69963 RepID=A0ABV6SHI7_AZOPA
MTFDVSAAGTGARLVASETFPNGFDLTSWADDSDPFDIPALTTASQAMNVNGDMVTWSTPAPIVVTINVLPGSPDDQNLQALLDANRPAAGRRVARDVITLTKTNPDGSTETLADGRITGGMLGRSVASAGRQKASSFTFAFQDIAVTRAGGQ